MAEQTRPFDLGFGVDDSWIIEMSYADAVVAMDHDGFVVAWQITSGGWKQSGAAGLVVPAGRNPELVSARCLKLRLQYVFPDDPQVEALFVDALAFRWQEADDVVGGADQADGAFEVLDSIWLAEHDRQELLHPGLAEPFMEGGVSSYRHLKLNFNQAGRASGGVLEVLCRGVLVQWLGESSWKAQPP